MHEDIIKICSHMFGESPWCSRTLGALFVGSCKAAHLGGSRVRVWSLPITRAGHGLAFCSSSFVFRTLKKNSFSFLCLLGLISPDCILADTKVRLSLLPATIVFPTDGGI